MYTYKFFISNSFLFNKSGVKFKKNISVWQSDISFNIREVQSQLHIIYGVQQSYIWQQDKEEYMIIESDDKTMHNQFLLSISSSCLY